MPELPEVETVARCLRQFLLGAEHVASTYYRDRLREPFSQAEVDRILSASPVRNIGRRGKYFAVETDAGSVVIHLGMTGQILRYSSPTPRHPHTHYVWKFRSASTSAFCLHYVDPRRFGRLGSTVNHLGSHPWLSRLGPEPLESRDLASHLQQRGAKLSGSVKAFIMKPEVVVGVGNIYACEALFKAGIAPTRPCRELSPEQWQRLASAVCQTLVAAIDAGGSTLRDYRTPESQSGRFQTAHLVYGRDEAPCHHCGTPIQRLTQHGRSSWSCPRCQV